MVNQNEEGLSLIKEDFEKLDSFYIETRYPGAYFETYTKDEAEEGLLVAEKIITEIKKLLNTSP